MKFLNTLKVSLHQNAHHCIEQSHKINCVATHTRVAPKFNWFIGETFLTSDEEIVMKNEEDDKSTYISTLNYKTSLDHLDKVLKCEVNHIAYDNQQLGMKH